MDDLSDLDALLYVWLSKTEGEAVERAFAEYYERAFTEITRYLRSLGPIPGMEAQDLAQDALVKLFDSIGVKRKHAADRLRNHLITVAPLDLGTFHVHALISWRAKIGIFLDAATDFRIDKHPQSASWKSARNDINAQIAPLTHRGNHFVTEAEAAKMQQQNSEASIIRFKTLVEEMCEDIPKIGIPSNGLLITIAKRLRIDVLRSPAGRALIEHDTGSRFLDEHNFEDPPETLESEAALVDFAAGEEEDDAAGTYAAFLAHLAAPLLQAQVELAGLPANCSRQKEQHRVDSLQKKFDRLRLVLCLLYDDPALGQLKISQDAGLNANQVKHTIHLLRQEYARFIRQARFDR